MPRPAATLTRSAGSGIARVSAATWIDSTVPMCPPSLYRRPDVKGRPSRDPVDMLEASGTQQRRSAAGAIGSYVATNIYEGRALFEVLEDEYVELRRDEYPD